MSAGELVIRCFHARTASHVLHLKTRSYAAHKALNEFYDEIVGLADTFAETYQGAYGLITDYPPHYTPYADALEMLDELNEWVTKNRYVCCKKDDTCTQNIIDEIIALIRSTQYKLTFLK